MNRTIACLLCLAVTSCTMRIGSEMRPTSAPAPTPRVASNTGGAPRNDPFRGHTLGRRIPRSRSTPSTSSPSSDGSIAQLCVDEINRYRASLGLHPLKRATERESCADGQIRDDAQSGHWHGKFGACGEGAQNECNSSPAPQADFIKGCLHGMWNEGPGGGHYENMKSPTATTVWCGFYTEPSGGVWSVQDFR